MWFQPVVSLNIKNNTKNKIKDLKITWKLDTVQSVTTIPILSKGESIQLKLIAQGGGLGYVIEYTVPDDSNYISPLISDYVLPGVYEVIIKE